MADSIKATIVDREVIICMMIRGRMVCEMFKGFMKDRSRLMKHKIIIKVIPILASLWFGVFMCETPAVKPIMNITNPIMLRAKC